MAVPGVIRETWGGTWTGFLQRGVVFPQVRKTREELGGDMDRGWKAEAQSADLRGEPIKESFACFAEEFGPLT